MDFNFDECVGVLLRGLTAGLENRRADIQALHKNESLWAMSFDVFPWYSHIAISFRIESESDHGASSNSGDWKHHNFIEAHHASELKAAMEYVSHAYTTVGKDGGKTGQDVAHLIFVAAANAILDERVAKLLRTCDIDAPIIGDSVPWNFFKYFVMDGDQAIKANYCDIVCAARVFRRLLNHSL